MLTVTVSGFYDALLGDTKQAFVNKFSTIDLKVLPPLEEKYLEFITMCKTESNLPNIYQHRLVKSAIRGNFIEYMALLLAEYYLTYDKTYLTTDIEKWPTNNLS